MSADVTPAAVPPGWVNFPPFTLTLSFSPSSVSKTFVIACTFSAKPPSEEYINLHAFEKSVTRVFVTWAHIDTLALRSNKYREILLFSRGGTNIENCFAKNYLDLEFIFNLTEHHAQASYKFDPRYMFFRISDQLMQEYSNTMNCLSRVPNYLGMTITAHIRQEERTLMLSLPFYSSSGLLTMACTFSPMPPSDAYLNSPVFENTPIRVFATPKAMELWELMGPKYKGIFLLSGNLSNDERFRFTGSIPLTIFQRVENYVGTTLRPYEGFFPISSYFEQQHNFFARYASLWPHCGGMATTVDVHSEPS